LGVSLAVVKGYPSLGTACDSVAVEE